MHFWIAIAYCQTNPNDDNDGRTWSLLEGQIAGNHGIDDKHVEFLHGFLHSFGNIKAAALLQPINLTSKGAQYRIFTLKKWED